MTGHPRPGRRAVLVALLVGAGAASGCTGVLDRPSTRAGRDRATVAARSPRPAPLTDDEHLVARAVAVVTSTAAVLSAVADDHRSLRGVLAPALEAHTAHASLLQQAGRDQAAADGQRVRVPHDERRALHLAADAESVASSTLRRQVLAADSGALARTLASIAASCAQRTTVLRDAADAVGNGRGRRS